MVAGRKSDVTRLADILEKKYHDSHDIKEENLGKRDATTQTEITQEVINLLNNGNQQDQIYVISTLTGFQ